jgi:hypothetical protein
MKESDVWIDNFSQQKKEWETLTYVLTFCEDDILSFLK